MRGLTLLLLILIAGCNESSHHPAPVVELKWQPTHLNSRSHIVKRGETLYAIAFRYDKDFRQLAAYNHLNAPYSLRVGQRINLMTTAVPMQNYRAAPVARKYPQTPYTKRPVARSYRSASRWIWPAQGRVVSGFYPQQGKKGIDIAGRKGDLIHASADGVVAYAGNGLSGYGNLIIIKHDGQFLTAYGNNARNRVAEGQKVKAGQIIAEMGIVDRKFWGVHFEIRQAGQPVNPMNYLRN